MVAYPLLKFVSTITASPTVLLDLNDNNLFSLKRDGFSVGAPAYDGDPLSVGVRWGYRTLTLNLQCYGTNAAATAEYGLLAREITKDSNLLMFQLDAAASPVFFTTYRTAPSEIQVDQVITDGGHTKSYWDVTVSLTAEPFAYGLRQDLTAVTIANSPLGTNPMNATLGTVLGDVPTPAYIYQSTGIGLGETLLLGIDHAAATTGTPPIDQAEGNTYPLADTTTVAVAAASGGNVARCTFASSSSLVKRITAMRVPTTEPGMYRLMARVRQATAGTSSYRLRYVETPPSGSDLQGNIVSFAATDTTWFLLDLGPWQFPAGSGLLQNGLTGVMLARDATSTGALELIRDTGTQSLDIDYITAIPAYGDLSFTTSLNINALTYYMLWDGYSDTQSVLGGATPFVGAFAEGALIPRTGGIPNLWPGQTNRLWYVHNIGVLGNGHDLTLTTTLSVSYWPRFLWLR